MQAFRVIIEFMLQEKLKEVKQEVDSFLKDVFAGKKKGIGAMHPEVKKMIEEIEDVTLRGGDRFRPFMVWLGANIRDNPLKIRENPSVNKTEEVANKKALLKVMCATELLQTFALIHDDIIDRAEMRRGGPTIKPDEKAILAGDLCFTFADELLNDLRSSVKKQFDILREEVISGEWLDVYYAIQRQLLLKQQSYQELLLKIYRYKTVSYTILQPFMMGWVWDPSAPPGRGFRMTSTIVKLQKALVNIGLAFQMKDDYLDLFGDARLGKKIGGDLKEGKLTVFHAKLMERHIPQKYLKIFGNKNLTQEDIEWVKKIIIELGIKNEIEEEMKRISNEAASEIRRVKGVNEKARELLIEMAKFVVQREY